MKKTGDKTNAVRILVQHGAKFTTRNYENTGAVSGKDVAAALDEDPNTAFKTLVTAGKSGQHYVFLVPVNRELDLKRAAAAVEEKSIAMVHDRELLPLTGYIHGGCSPIGMKKQFPTVIDRSAENHEHILFSGGKIGLQIEISLTELRKTLDFRLANVAK